MNGTLISRFFSTQVSTETSFGDRIVRAYLRACLVARTPLHPCSNVGRKVHRESRLVCVPEFGTRVWMDSFFEHRSHSATSFSNPWQLLASFAQPMMIFPTVLEIVIFSDRQRIAITSEALNVKSIFTERH